jgi:hypothetical protein
MSVPDPRIVERWRTTFAMWRSSGLSVAAFCRSRELNLSSFYRGRKILDDIDRPSATRPRSEPDPLPVQLNPWAYLTDVLTQLAAKPVDVNHLLPDAWAKQHLPAGH